MSGSAAKEPVMGGQVDSPRPYGSLHSLYCVIGDCRHLRRTQLQTATQGGNITHGSQSLDRGLWHMKPQLILRYEKIMSNSVEMIGGIV